jgi:hypothetical protein
VADGVRVSRLTTTIARRVALAGALAAALFAISPTAASAGQSQGIDTKGGYVSFNERDEILFATDDRGEGYSVIAQLRRRDGVVPISAVRDGDGANGNPNTAA